MIDSLMTKRFFLLFFFAIALTGLPAYAQEKEDIVISSLENVLGAVEKDYLGKDDYDDAQEKYYKIRLLSDYEPGLTKGIWKSSRSEDVIEQFKAFETVNGSPALRELWRITLLDDFRDISFGSNRQQKDVDLAIARLDTMIKLGFFHDAIRLYHAMNTKPVPVGIAQKAIDAMALAGMVDAACLEVSFVTQSIRSPDWLKKRLLCAIHNDEADITKALSTALEENLKDDAIHQSIARLLKKPTLDGPVKASLSPLQRALLLSHGGTYSYGAITKADPIMLASAAMSPYLSLQKRLKAAERAADIGVIGPKELLAIYERLPLSDEEVNQARQTLLQSGKLAPETIRAVISDTHDPEPRAKLIEKALQQKTYHTNIISQLWLKYVDKISSQAEEVQFFAPTGYALAIWQDYLAASKAFAPLVEKDLSILSDVSDINLPEDKEIEAFLAFIEKQHPDSFQLRKERILATLKAGRLIKDDLIDEALLEKWRKTKKDNEKRGILFLKGLNELSLEKPGFTSPEKIYQILENYTKNELFEENRKITLEIIVQSVL